jgi:hypothetical protein
MIASMVVDRNAAGTTDCVHLSSLPIRPLVERHMILPRYQWSFRQICRSPHTETTTSLPFVGMASIAAYGRDYGAEHTHLDLRTVRNCLPVANHVKCFATIELTKRPVASIHTIAGRPGTLRASARSSTTSIRSSRLTSFLPGLDGASPNFV